MSTPEHPRPSPTGDPSTLHWSFVRGSLASASTAAPISYASALDVELLAREAWQSGEVLLDEFEVEGILGQGGMGMVYLVRQRATQQQFAVKRARLVHADSRRQFLAELQLWMDLPTHSHLAPCRFFRTVDDEAVIFTDLATGGSLADWIVQARLRRLADVLDVAIQVAWGLHALHECGLVHQDVKPANVLMSQDGAARVADFGLARARARFHHAGQTGESQSVLVSGGAMTPAYCSPEQASGRPVSRRTDIWSWGVLLMEMFVGRVPCCERGGPLAQEVLRRYLEATSSGVRLAVMPSGVVAVIELCFAQDPAERWSGLAEAAAELAKVYRQCVGADYPRVEPTLEETLAPLSGQGVGRWESPRKWLSAAFQAAGRDPTEVEAVLPPAAATRRAQAVADMSAYEEARRMLDKLVASGRDDLRPELASLCVQKALVHGSVGDWPGALELFDRALEGWEWLVQGWGRRELTPSLVRTCLHKAQALRTLGRHDDALALCDRVLTLWDRLDNRRRRREMRADLAAANLVKGLVLRDRGNRKHAQPLLERAIELGRQLEEEGQIEPANDLAHALLALAGVVAAQGRSRDALDLCDEAIVLRRRLIQKEGRRDLEGDLARALVTRANVLRAQENSRASVALYEQAVSLYEHLIHDDGRDDLAGDLARTLVAQGHAVRILGDPSRAAELCGRATGLFEGLVHQQGRSDLQHELARAYLQQGNALRLAGQAGVSLMRCDQAIAVWERLVHRQQRSELGNDLARAYVGKAGTLRQLGQVNQALQLYDRAIALREALLDPGGREDVPADIARDRVSRAELLAELGDIERARQEVSDAAATLEAVLRATSRGDLRSMLTRARRLQERLTPSGAEK